jgi:tyrosyl-tRNA synthetase
MIAEHEKRDSSADASRSWHTGAGRRAARCAAGEGAVADIIDELSWRGLVAISTDLDELRAAFASGQVTAYGGFDPTAPGLHIGNLVLLITLRRLQLAGHRPIGLVGGATGLIGDPSGKSAERMLNPREVVGEWTTRLRAEIGRILDFSPGRSSALLVSNLDWTQDLPTLDFLRDIGKHFPVSQMLARESVRARLEGSGITYTEFSYQLLQAMDYLELYRRHDCGLQVGGSDQWGNLVGGVDLIRRVEGATVHALATPLITRPDGTKYGKTEGGAIWISPDLMSPYAFYQFWINRADAEVGGLLRVFTFRTREQIAELELATAQHPAAREAQRVLAQDVTTLVHGAGEYARAEAASRALFGQGDLGALDEATLAAALDEVPATAVQVPAPLQAVADGSRGETVLDTARPGSRSVLSNAGPVQAEARIPAVSELMARTGIVGSRSAARRAIAEGGAYLNNRRVTDADEVPAVKDLLHGRFLVLRRGRRTVGGVEVLVSERSPA